MNRLRNILLVAIFSLFVNSLTAVDDKIELVFQTSNKLVLEDSFDEAVEGYLGILEEYESANLHHNAGVVSYLRDDVGSAILHLERADRLRFASVSTQEILSLIRRSEGISTPNYSILHRTSRALPEWFWLSLVVVGFWGALFFGIYLFVLVRRQSVYRDLAVVFWLFFVVGFIACFGLSEDRKIGVLMAEENRLQVIPTEEGEAFLTLQPGEMAKLIKQSNNFVFIETATKVRGWVKAENFQLIR